MGPDAFRKARAPTPFDWEATATMTPPVGQEGEESERRKPRRRAFFDMAVDGVPAGRVEFELASDLLPVTSENFLRLCDGVAVASSSSPTPVKQYEGGGGEAEAVEEEQEAGEEKLCYEGSVVRLHMLPGIAGEPRSIPPSTSIRPCPQHTHLFDHPSTTVTNVLRVHGSPSS